MKLYHLFPMGLEGRKGSYEKLTYFSLFLAKSVYNAKV